MTQEEIEKKAYEAYPAVREDCYISKKDYFEAKARMEDKRIAFIYGLLQGMSVIESFPKIQAWIARDSTEGLGLYGEKPERINNYEWRSDSESYMNLTYEPKAKFPELKWEDEPIEVELLIRKV